MSTSVTRNRCEWGSMGCTKTPRFVVVKHKYNSAEVYTIVVCENCIEVHDRSKSDGFGADHVRSQAIVDMPALQRSDYAARCFSMEPSAHNAPDPLDEIDEVERRRLELEVALEASADPRSVRRELRGEHVKGLVGSRIRCALARHRSGMLASVTPSRGRRIRSKADATP